MNSSRRTKKTTIIKTFQNRKSRPRRLAVVRFRHSIRSFNACRLIPSTGTVDWIVNATARKSAARTDRVESRSVKQLLVRNIFCYSAFSRFIHLTNFFDVNKEERTGKCPVHKYDYSVIQNCKGFNEGDFECRKDADCKTAGQKCCRNPCYLLTCQSKWSFKIFHSF